jgi:hypothetical protein
MSFNAIVSGASIWSVSVGSPAVSWQSLIGRIAAIPRTTRLTGHGAITLFVFGVISMGGFMFSHTLGIDDEVKLFQVDDTWTWFRQGRFLIGAIELLVDQPVTPLFPYLMLAVSYVASHCFL